MSEAPVSHKEPSSHSGLKADPEDVGGPGSQVGAQPCGAFYAWPHLPMMRFGRNVTRPGK